MWQSESYKRKKVCNSLCLKFKDLIGIKIEMSIKETITGL